MNEMKQQNVDANTEEENYILIVDDDNTLLKFFKIHLNKFFPKIVVAKNATEALGVLEEKPVELVVSDFRMPRVDGIQFMKKVKKRDATIPFLFITGAMLTEKQTKDIGKISDGYLRKPFSVDDLFTFISSGLEKREKLLELSKIVSDNEDLRKLVLGKFSLRKIENETERQQAKDLLDHLSESA